MDGQAYAGTHVSFDTGENAVVNYTVDGATVFESAEVESRSDAEDRGGGGVSVGIGSGGEGGVDLSELTDVRGAAVANVNAQARTSANVEFDNSAEFEAHDNGNGVAVLKSGDEEQLVKVEVATDAEAETADESVVTFTSDGTESSVIVAGEGEANVNGEGDVAAHLEKDTNAVIRAYGEEKTEDDEEQERLISEGDVAAEVQFGERGEGEVVGDPAEFLADTTVETETETEAENAVSITVDRAESEGKVIMTTVTDAAVGTTDELSVEVDGEAAAEADTYSELEAGMREEPRYLTVASEAESQAQVLVAVDSFSEHEITVEGGTDGEMDDDGMDDDGESEDGEGLPGFTVLVALVAALTVAVMRQR